MDHQQQTEYDFFMRAAALFEDRAVALAHRDDILTSDLYRRYLADAQNARLWAERIQAGWRMVDK